MKTANLQTDGLDGRVDLDPASSLPLQVPNCVLIVDDDPVFLAVVETFFVDLGVARVFTALDGASGYDLFTKNAADVDLIVLDINMPEIDGVEFLRLLHQAEYKYPVLIASGAEANLVFAATVLAKAYSLNIVGTLKKPLELQRLQSMFRG